LLERYSMSRSPFDPCTVAVERYKTIAKWRNLWTILLFVFGSTVIVFSVFSISPMSGASPAVRAEGHAPDP
jgi:hypothetical protein